MLGCFKWKGVSGGNSKASAYAVPPEKESLKAAAAVTVTAVAASTPASGPAAPSQKTGCLAGEAPHPAISQHQVLLC